LVPLEQIRDDPNFHNVRLQADEEEMTQLLDSMSREGLKVPVELIASPTSTPDSPCFFVRAGFRRTAAARRLHWQRLPAIILPRDTPVIDEYWTNIIENSARSKLSTYEIANAAKTMREKFGVPAREFALRAGYSEPYIVKLLRCVDKLPQEIVAVWRNSAPIPVDYYDKWASLRPDEAIRAMLSYSGHHPKVVQEWRPPAQIREQAHPARMASATGLSRMQRLRFAVEAARELVERERELLLLAIDYCSGARDDVPGIYEIDKKKRAAKNKRREDLPPPENIADAAALVTELPPKED
jgi:ParB/RepB/Spo0J family partition protein